MQDFPYEKETEEPESTFDCPDLLKGEMLPWNVTWKDVSTTFANGIINHAEHLRMWVLNKYGPIDQEFTSAKHVTINRERIGWSSVTLHTKAEVIDYIGNCPQHFMHPSIDLFDDDIVIVSYIGHEKYIAFQFKKNIVSASIIRFTTTDDEETIINKIRDWLNEKYPANVEISTKWLNGVISW